MKKSIILLTILLSVSLPVCSNGTTQEQKNVIEVGLFKGPTGFGIIQVMENPPQLSGNARLNFTILPGPAEMVAKVAAGEVDIALFPTNIAAKLYSKGPGYKLAAVVGNGLLYMLTRGDESLSIYEGENGKPVYGVGKGATPDYLFQYILRATGRRIDVNYRFNNPTQLVQMYMAGEVNTVILPEPFATQIRINTPETKIVLDFQQAWKEITGSGQSYPISVVVVSPRLVKSNPTVIRQFLEAYAASIDFANNNPEEAGKLIEKYDIFPQALAVPAIPSCNLVFIPADKAKADVERFLKVLLDADPVSIGGKLPDEAFYLF